MRSAAKMNSYEKSLRSMAVVASLFLVCLAKMSAQATLSNTITSQTITAAHKIYLGEIVPLDSQMGPRPSFPMLKTALQSTGRFTLLPSSRGADLLLLLANVPSSIPYRGGSGPVLILNARDPQTFASLGTITVPGFIADQKAVTETLTALFSLDKTAPAPSFSVAAVPAFTGHPEAQSFFSLITDPDEETISVAKKIFVMNDCMQALTAPYDASVPEFTADVKVKGNFQVVPSLQDADLILALRGSADCIDSHCNNTVDELNLDVYSAVTGSLLTSMQNKAKEGNAKKGKPSPFQTTVATLEQHFEGMVQKELKNVAKRQAKVKSK